MVFIFIFVRISFITLFFMIFSVISLNNFKWNSKKDCENISWLEKLFKFAKSAFLFAFSMIPFRNLCNKIVLLMSWVCLKTFKDVFIPVSLTWNSVWDFRFNPTQPNLDYFGYMFATQNGTTLIFYIVLGIFSFAS